MSRFAVLLVWTISAVLTTGEVGPRIVFPAPASLIQRAGAQGGNDLQFAAPAGASALAFSRAEVDGMGPVRLIIWLRSAADGLALIHPGGALYSQLAVLAEAFLTCPTLHEPLLI